MTLKVHSTSKFATIGAAAVVAIAGAVLTHPRIARADSSPLATASFPTPAPAHDTGAFKLTALTPSALVSNSGRGQLEVCNETGRRSALDEASAMAPFTPSGSSTLEVSYNGKTEQIMPGDCYRMNAQHASITTKEPLGRRSDLEGSLAPARAGLLSVSNAWVSANAEPMHEEINEIRNELMQDDRTTRQATAELREASRELRLTAQELNGKPVA